MTDLNIRRIFRASVRAYFAPLTGAFKGIREELRRTDPWRHQRERPKQAQPRSTTTRG